MVCFCRPSQLRLTNLLLGPALSLQLQLQRHLRTALKTNPSKLSLSRALLHLWSQVRGRKLMTKASSPTRRQWNPSRRQMRTTATMLISQQEVCLMFTNFSQSHSLHHTPMYILHFGEVTVRGGRKEWYGTICSQNSDRVTAYFLCLYLSSKSVSTRFSTREMKKRTY